MEKEIIYPIINGDGIYTFKSYVIGVDLAKPNTGDKNVITLMRRDVDGNLNILDAREIKGTGKTQSEILQDFNNIAAFYIREAGFKEKENNKSKTINNENRFYRYFRQWKDYISKIFS